MRRAAASLMAVAALCAPRAAHAEGEKIVEIEVVENTKTSSDTVRFIADIEKGDTFDYNLLARVRQNLENSGLFKEHNVIAVPVKGGMKITIVAKDKHSWIIAPTVYLQPGNQGGGLGFGENNLFGTNKKLLIYGQIATADSLFIAGYLDPAFLGSPLYFRADTFVRREYVTEYSGGDLLDEPVPDRVTRLNYYNAGFLLGINVWKGMALDARLRGAYVTFGDPDCAQADADPLTAECNNEVPGKDGWDVSTELRLTYDKRATWYGVTSGTMFSMGYEQAQPGLGSDFDYWLGSVRFIKAVKFYEAHNLALKLSGSLGHHLPFQQELTSGGVNLRGYQNREFRGDTKASGTLEYSVPIFNIMGVSFRGLAFTDLAYTTFTGDVGNVDRNYLKGQTDIDATALRLGMGAGFRIYIRQIVLPLLGIDWGYAPQANEYHVYFAVGLTELYVGAEALVFRGGDILTLDPDRPRVAELAVQDGRIVASAAPGARVVDLGGGTLLPGLVDGHAHLYGLGRTMEGISVRGVRSEAEAAAATADAPGGPDDWIVGRGWDHELWAGAAFPSRASLDAIHPRRPVLLRRVDGHAAWVNGAALARAGVHRGSVDPPGGRIVRDARGEPTGVLVDAAAEPVLEAVPPDDDAARERKILLAARASLARGLTGVHEMGLDDATIAVYRRLAGAGRLPLRVYAFRETLPAPGERPDVDADGAAFFTLRGIKRYADGALGSRGAHMLAPYSDEGANVGLALATPEALAHAAQVAAAGGWQLAVHAIGDRANREVLDAYAPYAGRGLRFRVEHAQIVAPADLPRFAALGVVAAMQPAHFVADAPWLEARLGRARLHGAYAWRTLIDSGAHVVGGSDFPIEDASPLHGLHAAVTRAGGERLTLAQALALYTIAPAWASFSEGRRGVLAPGALADLTWLDRTLHADDRLRDVRVVATIVGGRMHERPTE